MEAVISKAEYDAIVAQNEDQKGQIARLKFRLEQLERLIFAAKSERFAPASPPEQLALFEGGADAGAVEVEKQKQITSASAQGAA